MRLKLFSLLAALALVAACETAPEDTGSTTGSGGETTSSSSGVSSSSQTTASSSGSSGSEAKAEKAFDRASRKATLERNGAVREVFERFRPRQVVHTAAIVDDRGDTIEQLARAAELAGLRSGRACMSRQNCRKNREITYTVQLLRVYF